MSQGSEKIRALVTFKKKLEKRIEELDSELKEFQDTLDTVNSILLDKGFRRGDMKEVAPPAETAVAKEEKPALQHAAEPESVIPLKTLNDEPLAIIYVDKQSLHVLPDESKNFSVNTPPFSHFLVERVLAKMQEKDNELVRMGQLTPDRMFAYNIVREGDLIREIVIKNVDEERLRELKSSIRWTLEKMYEKMKG
jgi:cell division septum initiation protein DivIVA